MIENKVGVPLNNLFCLPGHHFLKISDSQLQVRYRNGGLEKNWALYSFAKVFQFFIMMIWNEQAILFAGSLIDTLRCAKDHHKSEQSVRWYLYLQNSISEGFQLFSTKHQYTLGSPRSCLSTSTVYSFVIKIHFPYMAAVPTTFIFKWRCSWR